MSDRPDLSSRELARLAEIAQRAGVIAVREGRRWDPSLDEEPPALRAPGAVFVTWRRGEALRGCIGTMEPELPLALAAAHLARRAAFDDPRFPPVRASELADLTAEVTVLSPMERFVVDGYDALLGEVTPGVDGLLVEAGVRRATLLPSVWDQLPRPEEFVAALWHKAGLPPMAWPSGIEIHRYHTQHS